MVARFVTYLEFLGPLWFTIVSFSCFQGYQSKFRWQSYVKIFPGQLQCCLKARLIPKNLSCFGVEVWQENSFYSQHCAPKGNKALVSLPQ